MKNAITINKTPSFNEVWHEGHVEHEGKYNNANPIVFVETSKPKILGTCFNCLPMLIKNRILLGIVESPALKQVIATLIQS